jgi:TolB-like protein/Tfp pilus assembly protein PilF
LKRKLEFEDEINRSAPPNSSFWTTPQTSAGQAVVDTANQSIAETEPIPSAPTKSGAEYVIGRIGRHKIAFGGIAVAVLVSVGLGLYLLAGDGKAIDSVAIIPLTNVGADPNTEYLSDGLTESLISNLSQLSNLKVMSQSSVFRYKGREIDPLAVGRELKVSAVLTGRVVQRGDTLGISLELVDARDNRQLWGEQYNRKLSDILSLQTEISREVSEKLRVRLSGVEKERVTKHYTENTDAYQLYLQGRYYQNKRTDEGLAKSIEYFQKAIAQDSNYALAYTGLADSHSYRGNHGFLPPNEVFPKAKTAVLKALEIDDSLAEAHTSLGYIRVDYDWDWASAEKEFKRAIELNPNYTRAHSLYAALLGARGRFDDALGEMKLALEPDPLSLYDNTNLGCHFYFARRYDDAIAQYKKTLDMDPSFAQAHLWFGLVYEQKKMYREAITEFQKAIALYKGSATASAALGHAYAIAGNTGEALRMLQELKDLPKRKYVSCYDIAVINAGLGDKDQVFVWLEKAYEERDGWLAFWAKVDPRLDGVRADPRFADLLRRIGHTP